MKQLRKTIEQIVAFIMCMVLLTGNALADEEGPFPDVPADADYAEAVTVLSELGILKGDESGNFNPNNTITRAEVAVIICRMLGIEDEAKMISRSSFSDVPTTYWAVGYIEKAVERGIISGYGNEEFGPTDSITYEQTVKMIVCACDLVDQAEDAGGYPKGYLTVAQDYGITANTVYTQDAAALRSTVAVLFYNSIYG